MRMSLHRFALDCLCNAVRCARVASGRSRSWLKPLACLNPASLKSNALANAS